MDPNQVTLVNRSDDGNAGKSQNRMRIPLLHTARSINRGAGLYLSESQQRGLAAGLFVGAIAAFAGLTWLVGRAVREAIE